MFMVNGTDYTLPLFAVASAAVLFTAEYLICRKAKGTFPKLLPLGYVALILVLAVVCLKDGDTGGFLDLRGFFALLLCGYAATCAAAICLGWLLARRKAR